MSQCQEEKGFLDIFDQTHKIQAGIRLSVLEVEDENLSNHSSHRNRKGKMESEIKKEHNGATACSGKRGVKTKKEIVSRNDREGDEHC